MNHRLHISLALIIAVAILEGCAGRGEERRPEQAPQVTVGNELAAMTRLRSIGTAEFQYQVQAGNYGTLEQLIQRSLISDPSQGKLANYRFEVRVSSSGFEATAVPLMYGVSGKRSFFLDETRILRGADKNGALASASDPEV